MLNKRQKYFLNMFFSVSEKFKQVIFPNILLAVSV